MCGNSKVIIPVGLSKIFNPFTKSLRSGTWAKTLFPTIRSANLPSSFSSFAVLTLKNFVMVGIPFSLATFATFTAGSIPKIGIFFFLKNCNKYPSLLAISTTRLFLSKLNFSIIILT